MGLSLKPGVNVQGLRPEILLAMIIARDVYVKEGLEACCITSVCDGKHSPTSLHYAGQAFDIRIWDIAPDALGNLVLAIRAALTTDYDVVLEKDHIHVEYQPRYRSLV